MRRARKVDGNQGEICKAFEALGVRVHRTNSDWDLTIQYGWATMLIEVKDPTQAANKGARVRRSEHQKSIHDGFRVRIVKTVEDAADCARVLRNWSIVGLCS